MRTLVTAAIAGVLGAALVWLPLPGMWWHVVRWACYVPIVSVSLRHGPMAGFFAGLAASLLYASVAASMGMGNLAWLSILVPDFPVVGLFGGRLFAVGPRLKRPYDESGAETWRAPTRISEADTNIELNSLTSIQTAVELLAEEGTSIDLRRELIEIISAECEHLAARIAGLVRQDRRSTTAEIHEADLQPIIDAAAREAAFILCGRGIVVRNESAPDLPPIQCNPDQIRELLMSLAVNATQSVPAGTEVILDAHRGNDGVILDVKDQVKASFGHRLARGFFASRPVTTGVALGAAYDIVQQHGGRIEAKVNVRKGLEFSVWLPLQGASKIGG